MFESTQVVARWGAPVDVFDYHGVSGTYEPRHERVYEGEWSLTSAPREPTPREAYAVLSNSVREWEIEHPEDEIRYLEITRGSPQRMLVQFLHHGHSPVVLATILVALAAVVVAIAKIAIPILTIALVVIGIWAAYRAADYFIPDKAVYYCPKCEREFPNYESLVSHYEYEHPKERVPPKPGPGVLDYVKYALVAAVGIAGFRYAVWPMIKEKRK